MTLRGVLIGTILATSWVASAWTAPEELNDIADEVEALAQNIPHHPFAERWALGKEVNVTLPQLADRLAEVEVRLRHRKGVASETFRDLDLIQWELKDLQVRVEGIETIPDEPSFLVMRNEMLQGLENVDRRMDALLRGREQQEVFAH